MDVRFREVGPSDVDRLGRFLSAYKWPFHAQSTVDSVWVRERAAEGYFFGDEVKSFWVLGSGDAPLGLVRAFDLADVTPLVDLRMGEGARNSGSGTAALRWITRFVFANYAETPRLGGYTQSDNVAMRRVFEKCGFVQEAYHRSAWRVDDGAYADAVGYAILRAEWVEP
jgi:RimJ/RimL family protein N-acetyltransferase